ncbi:MAG: TldD/PmbA family protein [Candidatus Cloacimonetes bacterium]|nr:TldD/PmbA family protein [Candidatus Cloacimonadota bacterium]
MFDSLKNVLALVDADYADIRYEVRKTNQVAYSRDELTHISADSTDGFVLRVLKNGGFSSVVFTRPDDAAAAAAKAMENARLLAQRQDKPVRLASVEPVVATFSPTLVEDPRLISIEEKQELVRAYNAIPLKHDKIVTTMTGYTDIIREKYFLSTEGAQIHEDLVTSLFGCSITAKDGTLTQGLVVLGGGSDGFQTVRGLEASIERYTGLAIDLLNAEPVHGGVYNCVLNPSMTGVFTHEAFGHFSEADIIERLPAMRKKMYLGSKLGSDVLNIVDDATIEHEVGFYRFDDEGVPVRRVQLIKDGVLTGRLHSRKTAAEFNEPVSGHMIAEDHRYAPIIRMGTIYIEPGEFSQEDLFERLGDGIYLVDKKGGQTAGENFSFGAMYGWEIKNGKKGRLLRDLNISGNLYQTLADISHIGNDLEFSKRGGCGKGQINHRSCMGGPHVLIKNLVVGGAS